MIATVFELQSQFIICFQVRRSGVYGVNQNVHIFFVIRLIISTALIFDAKDNAAIIRRKFNFDD
jgi:hypothetical protein